MHSALKLALSHAGRRLPHSGPVAFYDSFGGAYADNPRALFETALREPSACGGFGERFSHVWSLRTGVTEPDLAGRVRPESAAFAWAASRAQVIFANSGLPRYFSPRPGSTFVQTWHGTPLKKIGFDIAQPRFAGGSKYFERLRRDVGRWDILISPNPYSTRIFRSAFRFQGQILETGYPRNDILVGPQAALRRTEARAALGILPGTTAVLYAPTWRDSDVSSSGSQTHRMALEPERLVTTLGYDIALLLRLHPLVADTAVRESANVLNVSQHPDMRDLLLAADVLVTDYSSSMFDFAATGKPLIFYAYDLDRYANDERGFYFDLLSDAPGPVARNEGELREFLQDIAGLSTPWREKYTAFRQQFCALEDGKASERILTALADRRP